MNQNTVLIKQKSQVEEVVAQLKLTYPTVFVLSIAKNDEETDFHYLILRKLDRVTYTVASKFAQTDELQAAEIMLKNLTIHGDINPIIEDFDMLRTASVRLLKMLEIKGGDLKKY